ncbi:Dihydroneopterin aldolase-domain-containing protein [Chaetomidium leptoderma]|uniref:Dihydroneopterin aldolase-domain-containing protein n=1 Tax=Chaetomidium leptoderma TaxID=669021 RepID=A0AAN6VV94_9PEZI|nr:Dihydroneopterin aldolase-domain-containing protein [Chaetomidium leptoderma]
MAAPSPPLQTITTPRLRALCPDPPATVQIRNLTTTLQHSGHDAWNRAGKAQPCQISASVAFAAPFATAAAHDRLGADTVHYGTLSKAVLASVGRSEVESAPSPPPLSWDVKRGVWDVLRWVWVDLTGVEVDGTLVGGGSSSSYLLDVKKVRLLSVTVSLPKASLLGDGVSLTMSGAFEQGSGRMEARAMALEVSRLKVPTLVGVNDNERLAKQFVVATVTVEGFTPQEDLYTEIERDVVKAMEESSFETLEALGAHLAERVLASPKCQDGWQVCVRMEKPTAVPMADCPIVEVRATRESLKRESAAGTS